jgi:hypothetical protein
MSCPMISRTWFGSALNIKIMDQPISNFRDWLSNAILNLKEEHIIQIASITYNIWQARNQSIYDQRIIPEADIILRSARCIQDYIQAHFEDSDDNSNHNSSSGPHSLRRVPQHRWQPPTQGIFKSNSDANLQEVGWWGLGSIIRDELGLVMAAATWRLKGSDEAITAEAFALLLTVRLARDCGFEADNERVIKLVQNEKIENRSYLGKILDEIRVLQSSFDTCQFRFISRKYNNVAHNMAHLAHSCPDRVWIEEVPLDVQDMYYHDILI